MNLTQSRIQTKKEMISMTRKIVSKEFPTTSKTVGRRLTMSSQKSQSTTSMGPQREKKVEGERRQLLQKKNSWTYSSNQVPSNPISSNFKSTNSSPKSA